MTALGHAACRRGHSVLFTGAMEIINTLAAAHAGGGIKRVLHHLCVDLCGVRSYVQYHGLCLRC